MALTAFLLCFQQIKVTLHYNQQRILSLECEEDAFGLLPKQLMAGKQSHQFFLINMMFLWKASVVI